MADGTGRIARGAGGVIAAGLDARLAIWLSPAFPVGAFAYSHGLEMATERGWIKDRATLEAWLRDLLELGSLRNDLVLVAAAWRTAASSDRAAFADVNELALALQPSAERHLESVTQGNAFAGVIRAAWPPADPDAAILRVDGDIAYPVAVAGAAAAHAIPLEGTLAAYAMAVLSSLVSAAIRLSAIGQTDGQRVIAASMPGVNRMAELAAAATLDDLGSLTLRSDIASLAHETQYSRLFRS